MTRPHSEDIRERALARADAGDRVRSIAQALQISPSCVTKRKNLRRDTGGLAPGEIGGHKKPVLSAAVICHERPILHTAASCENGSLRVTPSPAHLAGRSFGKLLSGHSPANGCGAISREGPSQADCRGVGADIATTRSDAQTTIAPSKSTISPPYIDQTSSPHPFQFPRGGRSAAMRTAEPKRLSRDFVPSAGKNRRA